MSALCSPRAVFGLFYFRCVPAAAAAAAAGLIPMLGVPLTGGGAGTEALLAQAVAAASARRLVAPGSHVVAVMSYRGDLVLQARGLQGLQVLELFCGREAC